MKKFMNVFLGIATVVSLAIANSRVAVADIITVVNPGFEDSAAPSNGLPNGVNTPPTPGWSNGGTGAFTGGNSGLIGNEGAGGSTQSVVMMGADPDGGSIVQLTNHTIAAGETYSLSFYSRADSTGAPSLVEAGLYYVNGSGDRVLFGSSTTNVSAGAFTPYSMTASETADSVGKYVGIYFADKTVNPATGATAWDWGYVDNVSLTFTAAPVPEPSTMILLGAGLVGLLAYAWRRRRN